MKIYENIMTFNLKMIVNQNVEQIKINDILYENIIFTLILIKRLDIFIKINNGYIEDINGFYFIITIGNVISSIFTLIFFDRHYCKKFIYKITLPLLLYIILNRDQIFQEEIFPIVKFLYYGFTLIYFICLNRFIF